MYTLLIVSYDKNSLPVMMIFSIQGACSRKKREIHQYSILRWKLADARPVHELMVAGEEMQQS